MNIKTLIPKIETKYCLKPLYPVLQTHQQAIASRIKQTIYVDSNQFVQRSSHLQQAYANSKSKSIKLNGISQQIAHSLISHKTIQIATSSINQIKSIIQTIFQSLVNNFQYLQIIVLCKSVFHTEHFSQFPKDGRWIIIPFEKIKLYNLSSISQIIAININQKTAKSLFKLKNQTNHFNVLLLSQNRTPNLSDQVDIKIYRLDQKMLKDYQQRLLINNQIPVISQYTLKLRLYQTIIKGLSENRPIVVVTNQNRLDQLQMFVNNNFMDIKVKIITDFNIKQQANKFLIFVDVEKPAFMKFNKNMVILKMHQQLQNIQNSNRLDQTWTTMMSDISMVSDIESTQSNLYQNKGLSPVLGLKYLQMKLLTMDFRIAGSFIRFTYNQSDTFMPHDYLIMHSKNIHPQIQKLDMGQKNDKAIELIRPKQKNIKVVGIVNHKLSQSVFTKLVSYIDKHTINTISFREGEDLDCFELLKYISQEALFNDIMKHFTITFDFNNKNRYERFVLSYIMDNKQQNQ